jgi:hypothetical protein
MPPFLSRIITSTRFWQSLNTHRLLICIAAETTVGEIEIGQRPVARPAENAIRAHDWVFFLDASVCIYGPYPHRAAGLTRHPLSPKVAHSKINKSVMGLQTQKLLIGLSGRCSPAMGELRLPGRELSRTGRQLCCPRRAGRGKESKRNLCSLGRRHGVRRGYSLAGPRCLSR